MLGDEQAEPERSGGEDGPRGQPCRETPSVPLPGSRGRGLYGLLGATAGTVGCGFGSWRRSRPASVWPAGCTLCVPLHEPGSPTQLRPRCSSKLTETVSVVHRPAAGFPELVLTWARIGGPRGSLVKWSGRTSEERSKGENARTSWFRRAHSKLAWDWGASWFLSEFACP